MLLKLRNFKRHNAYTEKQFLIHFTYANENLLTKTKSPSHEIFFLKSYYLWRRYSAELFSLLKFCKLYWKWQIIFVTNVILFLYRFSGYPIHLIRVWKLIMVSNFLIMASIKYWCRYVCSRQKTLHGLMDWFSMIQQS